jgi:hypothetical protein
MIMMSFYSMLTEMMIVAMIKHDAAAYRRLLPLANLLTQVMPLGFTKGKEMIFYLLTNSVPSPVS